MLRGPNIFKYGQVSRFENENNEIFVAYKCTMALQTYDNIFKTDQQWHKILLKQLKTVQPLVYSWCYSLFARLPARPGSRLFATKMVQNCCFTVRANRTKIILMPCLILIHARDFHYQFKLDKSGSVGPTQHKIKQVWPNVFQKCLSLEQVTPNYVHYCNNPLLTTGQLL